MECCITWPGLHNHLIQIQLWWIGMSWTGQSERKAANKFSTPLRTSSRLLENPSRRLAHEADWEKKKRKTLNRMCPNFWLVLYVTIGFVTSGCIFCGFLFCNPQFRWVASKAPETVSGPYEVILIYSMLESFCFSFLLRS